MSWLRLGLVFSIFAVLLAGLSRWVLIYGDIPPGTEIELSLSWVLSHLTIFGFAFLGLAATQIVKHEEQNGVLKSVRYSPLGWALNVFAAILALYIVSKFVILFPNLSRIKDDGFLTWLVHYLNIIFYSGTELFMCMLSLTLSRLLASSKAADLSDHKP